MLGINGHRLGATPCRLVTMVFWSQARSTTPREPSISTDLATNENSSLAGRWSFDDVLFRACAQGLVDRIPTEAAIGPGHQNCGVCDLQVAS
jgi:hypothetical protein